MTASVSTVAIEPFGLQREMVRFAEYDADGEFLNHTYTNIYELLKITGPVDLDLLGTAARIVVSGMDVCGGRLRQTPAGPRFVAESHRDRVSLVEAPLPGGLDGFGESPVRDVMRTVAHIGRDLRTDPPVQLVAGRADDDTTLLLCTVDHLAADGRTLALLVRRIGHCYRALRKGDEAAVARSAAFPSFFAYAAGEAAHGQPEAARYWSAALARSADPATRPQFPGGRWKPRGTRDLTARAAVQVPASRQAAVQALADRLGQPLQAMFLSATEFAVSCWAAAEVPINLFRSARFDRASLNVPGPLAEQVVTVPGPADGTVGTWLTGFCDRNVGAPRLHGLSLRELETPESDDARLVLFNFVPSAKPVSIGAAIAVPAEQRLTRRLNGFDELSRFGVRVHVWKYVGEPLQIVVYSDPEILPEPAGLAAAIVAFLDVVLHRPDLSMTAARAEVRAAGEHA